LEEKLIMIAITFNKKQGKTVYGKETMTCKITIPKPGV
jgi:hypothetical protein